MRAHSTGWVGRLTLGLGAILGTLALAGPALGSGTAHPQAWADPDPFLVRLGLPETNTTIVLGDRATFPAIVAGEYAKVAAEPSAALMADVRANGGPDGLALPAWSSKADVVMVADDLGAFATAYAIEHEVGHRVSVIRGDDACLVVIRCERSWRRTYEEGLVDAWTSATVGRYWRFLTGKAVDPAYLPLASQPHYPAEARLWRAAAKAATGKALDSRQVREYLTAALLRGAEWRELALCDPLAAGIP